jgi:hypothetical protein
VVLVATWYTNTMLDKKLNNEEKLEHIYQMTLENHEILKSIRRQQYMGNVFRVLYWLVILGALGGMYYYLRPVVMFLSENSGKINEALLHLNVLKDQLPEAKIINQVLEGLQKSATSGQ